jgi:hypothetical protein
VLPGLRAARGSAASAIAPQPLGRFVDLSQSRPPTARSIIRALPAPDRRQETSMNLGLQALLAFTPIALSGVLLVGLGWPAKRAMPVVYVVTALIALFAGA